MTVVTFVTAPACGPLIGAFLLPNCFVKNKKTSCLMHMLSDKTKKLALSRLSDV